MRRLRKLEENLPHLPEFSLFARAPGHVRGLERMRMNLLQRPVATYKTYFACIDVVFS